MLKTENLESPASAGLFCAFIQHFSNKNRIFAYYEKIDYERNRFSGW